MRKIAFLVISVVLLPAPSVAAATRSKAGNPLRQAGQTDDPAPSIERSVKKSGDLPAPRKSDNQASDPQPEMPDETVLGDWDSEWIDDSEWMQYSEPYGAGFGINGLFVRAEYLLWATSGLDLPPLVTTSANGTARAAAGVLGQPTTTVLFGDSSIHDEMRSGAKITFGTWLGAQRGLGVEGDYFGLSDERTDFTRSSTGSPIIARPFFNMVTALESAELIAFPNLISGTVDIDVVTRLQGAGARLVIPLCSGDGCGPAYLGQGRRGDIYEAFRYNLLAGYRFARLDDRLDIREDLTSLNPQNPGTFQLLDRFQTENQFHGADLGMSLQTRRGPWTLEGLVKVGIGNNRGTVRIDGATDITQGGITDRHSGGLLAQRTNIGNRSQDQFAMLPELGATVGLNLNSNWRITCGYTLLYWSRVLRAGDQIDLDLNPNLLPPEANPFTGPLRPRFEYHYTDFWAQGLNLGLEGRW